MEAYKKHLAKDLKLKPLLKLEITLPVIRKNVGLRLMRSIMGQQLSTKVAQVIYERFLNLFGGKEPKAQEVLQVPLEKLRSLGLSNNKAQYVHNVANFIVEHKITDKKLLRMSDEDVIELLTQIKGVGRWTVEMLLMFTLGNDDTFAVDDLGIQKAMIKTYKLQKLEGKALKLKMLKISEQWKPYRTYACLHLWKSLDVE